MAEKEYHATIRVRLTDDMLPRPMLSKDELESLLAESLDVGGVHSAIASISVGDPRSDSRQRRY